MTKMYMLLAAAMMISMISAADVPYTSSDREALAATAKRKPGFIKLNYLVRIAELDDPSIVNDFDTYMAAIEEVGKNNNFSAGVILDSQVFTVYNRRTNFIPQGYLLAREKGHPYEIRFMYHSRAAAAVRKVYPTPAKRYAAALALLNRNFKLYVAWSAPRIMNTAIDAIIRDGRAGKVASMKSDLQAFKKRIEADARARKAFAGVPAKIDKVAPVKAADVHYTSSDRAALAAAAKKKVGFIKLNYLVRIAELDDPAILDDFDTYMAAVEKTGTENKMAPGIILDSQVFLIYNRHRKFFGQGYLFARENNHPYEIRFMINPLGNAEVNKLYPTPAERYEAALSLIKRHFNTYVLWNSPRIMDTAFDYIIRNGKAGKVGSMKSDLQNIKKFINGNPRAKKSFAGIPAKIDKVCAE